MLPRFTLLLSLLILPVVLSHAQPRISVQHGDWNAPSTWSDNIIPTVSNSSAVIIAHEVFVPAEETVSIDDLAIGGRLVVHPGARLNILNGDGVDLAMDLGGVLDVYGMVTGHDGIELAGLTGANTRFYSGSTYRHLAAGEGSIPVAHWDPNSTFEIRGISAGVSMQSPGWGQGFGNLVYDCPEQGSFVDFDGRLGTIAGDLVISNTNANILRLSRSHTSILDVSGSIRIEGPSEIWFTDAGDCAISVGGDFQYRSTSTASSYFATTGKTIVTIGGDLVIDAEHRLKLASGTSSGHTGLTLTGDLHMIRGKIDALGSGTGAIVFDGPAQHVFATNDDETGFEGNISYRIGPTADVDLHQSLIGNTTGGGLIVEGTLRLGSASQTGTIQAGESGNIQVSGSIVFGETSRVVFNGAELQHIHYPGLHTDVVLDNPSGVVLYGDAQFGSLTIGQGWFRAGGHTVGVTRSLSCTGQGMIAHEGTVVLNGAGDQVIDLDGDTLHHVAIEQTLAGTVWLESTLHLSGTLSIRSPGSGLVSGGRLILLSSSERPGATASIGSLPEGSGVFGDVTVQRFIEGAAGDRYRYVGSPVADATVASLMDDVPVTGIFEDADSGPGLPDNAPSLFRYREETASWDPYPVSGTSATNYFEPGRGYCFFNWNETTGTNWDVTGEINQGAMTFGLTYTADADAQLSGWNLVANPYPATIVWEEKGWMSDNVSAGIAVRDNLSGGFRYWDGQVGSLTDGHIAAGQAFWVRAVGTDPVLRIDEGAKTGAGAEYYRKRPPDYLELAVRAAGRQDHVFLRVREGATEGLDAFDAPKLRSDALSLSFRTADAVKVAINAVPGLPCLAEIPIDIGGLGGNPDLEFIVLAGGLVYGSSYAILDAHSGRRYDFDENGLVTVPGSADFSALRLAVESGVPSATTASAPAVVCAGDSLAVRLEGGQRGVRFYLQDGERRVWALPGSTSRWLYFPADSLSAGRHPYALFGGSACSGPSLIDTLVVMKPLISPPAAGGGFHCGPGTVDLQAEPSPGHEIRWYDTANGTSPVGSGSAFVTPVLSSSRDYHVSLADRHGCESNRVQVVAEIRPAVRVRIDRSGDMLTVAGDSGLVYTWYRDDSLLHEATDRSIHAGRGGVYTVMASSDGCSATDRYDMTVTGIVKADAVVGVFPVPCTRYLHVRYAGDRADIRVCTSAGVPLRNLEIDEGNGGCRIDLWAVPAGHYILRIVDKSNQTTVRIVKSD